MKVNAIIALAQDKGAQVGSPYSTEEIIAKNVEGEVIQDRSVAKDGYDSYRLLVKDDTGELKVRISSQSYTEGKTKYNLAVQKLDRKLDLSNGQSIAEGTKMLRAI